MPTPSTASAHRLRCRWFRTRSGRERRARSPRSMRQWTGVSWSWSSFCRSIVEMVQGGASASVRLRGSARGGGSSGPPMQGLDPDQPRVLVDAGGDGQPVDLAEDIGGEDVLAGADRADAAPIEQDHVVGHRGRMSEIVEDDADGDAMVIGEFAHEVEDLRLVAQVEVIRRFVEQQHTGVLGQAGRQPDTLQLAAGELIDG